MSSPAPVQTPAPSPSGNWWDNLPYVAQFFTQYLPAPWEQWAAVGGVAFCVFCCLCCLCLLILLR